MQPVLVLRVNCRFILRFQFAGAASGEPGGVGKPFAGPAAAVVDMGVLLVVEEQLNGIWSGWAMICYSWMLCDW
jgi:hypothetical protein